jgi:hypothetical protein
MTKQILVKSVSRSMLRIASIAKLATSKILARILTGPLLKVDKVRHM